LIPWVIAATAVVLVGAGVAIGVTHKSSKAVATRSASPSPTPASSPSPTPVSHELSIFFQLTNKPELFLSPNKKGCNVKGTGYQDLSAGAPVTVKDATGTILASTFLPRGTTVGNLCEWTMSVTVPDSTFYQIEVSHRGEVTFAESDLETNGWEADLSIGG
jgi:hypothetical protein